MAENGLTPNNAMLYAFTSKMKKMQQKKFQNFPKIQRPRRRVSGLCFTQTRTSRDVVTLSRKLRDLDEFCDLHSVALILK